MNSLVCLGWVLRNSRPIDLTAWIAACPWPDLRCEDSFKYLGLLMGGRDITTKHIFAAAFDKLRERARAFYHPMRSLSVCPETDTYR